MSLLFSREAFPPFSEESKFFTLGEAHHGYFMDLFAYRMSNGDQLLICWKCTRRIPAEREHCPHCIRVEQNCSVPDGTLDPAFFRIVLYLGTIGLIALGLFVAARFGGA